MKGCNLPYQRKTKAGTAEGSAAGLVYTEEGLKDTLLIFLRNSPSRIGNKDQKLFGLLGDADLYRTVWTIVFDRILCQIEDHTIDQCVAAGHNTVTCKLQSDAGFLRQRRKVCENFLHHGSKLNGFVSFYLLQITHLQQGFCHLGQPFCLFLQQGEKVCRLRQHVGMLCTKKLQLGLHQRQGCAQLVGSVAGKLFLGRKGIV